MAAAAQVTDTRNRQKPAFVHLKVHSAYSLLEGALTIEKLAKLAKADGMPALALTDTNNLFGALEFSEKLAGSGIQPIIGCTFAVAFEEVAANGPQALDRQARRVRHGRLALIAQSETGYQNLMALSSHAYLDGAETGDPQIPIALLGAHCEGLIALTGGPDGPIDSALAEGQAALAAARLARLIGLFSDRLYVEIQRHGIEREQAVEPDLLRLAYAHALPLVATNEAYFASPGDYEAHDTLLCVADGAFVAEDNRRRLSSEHSFKSAAEMVELFADLPEAIEATMEIAQRCAYRPRTRKPILPPFVRLKKGASAQASTKAEAEELMRQAREGLERRLKDAGTAPGIAPEQYWERLDFELGVIVRMQYQGYFLIVADFIQWAKASGIPVGPGRGSGAGSVVAWSLTITDLDPMRFGLLFERFLNPERVSMPDFDIDFCQERRDEVIRYVKEKYGADRVAQIITFGRLQARMVLRDVGRVLQMPYGQVDKLCKLVPNNPANPVTLEEAIGIEPKLSEARDADPLVAQLMGIAQKLEGLYRNASTHAAGVVIGDRPLVELVPLYRDPRAELPATQFNMKWVEQAGLVKFDFLGLKTLTVLRKAEEMVRAKGLAFDLARLGLDDGPSYELLARGDTAGVFQLEGQGMRDSLRKLKPNRFEDIIAMVALYRPGPMDNIPTYINRKHGAEAIEDLHPLLMPILRETYGVIIYQEQVMQIAQVLSGYSLGEADLLRRAMGKKIKEEMAQQRARFVEGAVGNGVDKPRAEYIFDLVDKFAGYGFNKSHAAAYALLAYQTAYLKANHPVEFLAASMTLDLSNTDKLAGFAEEARRMGVRLLTPDINASGVDFLPENGRIRYALSALKNVGTGVIRELEAERQRRGPFQDLADFARRLDARAFNKRTLETLAASGAFDGLERNRAQVHANIDNLLALAQRTAADRAAGQNDLFGGGAGAAAAVTLEALQLRPVRPWPPMDALAKEFEAVGYYLSGHPLDAYEGALKKLGARRWADFEAGVGEGTTGGLLAGIVTFKKERRAKSGNRFAFAGFSDQTGQFEAVMFSEVLSDAAELLEPGTAVLVNVEAERQGDAVKLRALLIRDLNREAGGAHKGLNIVCAGGEAKALLSHLGEVLVPGKGTGQVRLLMQLPELRREAEVRLPGRYDISPAQASALRALPGVLAVKEF